MPINDYATGTEIKSSLPDGNWGTDYDLLLIALATRASRMLDILLNRKPGSFFVNADVTLYYDGSGGARQLIDELATAPTSVAVAESGDIKTPTYTTWAATDYMLWPYNALDDGRPYTRLDIDDLNGTKTVWYAYRKAVKIIAKFGYALTVPDVIKEATIIQSARWFKRGQQAFQDTGAIAELGQLTYTKAIDPDIATLVLHLRRISI